MKFKIGDITEADEKHIIHGCNAQGVMGSGVALAIRKKWPVVYEEYRNRYDECGLYPGDVVSVKVSDEQIVHNFITQEYYGRDGKKYASLGNIVACWVNLLHFDYEWGNIAIPRIGCGLGGLQWPCVEEILLGIENGMDNQMEFIVYDFEG